MKHVGSQILRNIVSGIFIVLPAVTTIYVFVKLFAIADSMLPTLFNSILPFIPREWIPGVGLLMVLIIAYFIGIAAKNYFGKKLIELGNSIISTIPLMNKVYLGVQQILDAIAGQKKKLFEKVVLIQYPRDGTYCIGFLTSHAKGEVPKKAGEDLVSVFLPTTPNPTSGFLLYYRAEEVIELEMSIETAIKIIMSAGVVSADQLKRTQHMYTVPANVKRWDWRIFGRRKVAPGYEHDIRD